MKGFIEASKKIFLFSIGVFALIIAFRLIDLNLFKSLLENISLKYFLLFLLFFFITFFISSIKWLILIRSLGARVSILDVLKYNLMSFFIAFITPSLRLGGEPLRMYMLKKKHDFPYEKSAASIIGDFIISLPVEIFVVLTLSSLVFLFADIGSNIKIVYSIFSLFFLLFLVVIFTSVYKEKKIVSNFLRIIYNFNKSSKIWRAYMKVYSFERLYINLLRSKNNFYSVAFYSFMGALTRILAFVFGFLALTHSIDLSTTFLSYIAFSFTSFTPVPGSLGVQEIGQILLTQENSSVAFSILIRFYHLCLMVFGLFFIIKEGVLFGSVFKKFFRKFKK